MAFLFVSFATECRTALAGLICEVRCDGCSHLMETPSGAKAAKVVTSAACGAYVRMSAKFPMSGKTSMTFGEAVRIATASLWAHKLRSVLTLLGVVIGVTSVIAVVSIVNGLNRYVAEKVFNLGADVFLVSRGPLITTNIDQYEETQKRRKFRLDDYEYVRDTCRSCVAVGADIDHQNAQVKYGTNYLSNTHVLGWSGEMPQLYDLDLMVGRHVNQNDVARGAPVCTVGWDIADKLLPGSDPIGKDSR